MEPSLHPISGEIEVALGLVAREVGHLSVVMDRLDQGGPLQPKSQEEWEASSLCASATEKIYTGCERVMTRIVAEIDGERVNKDDGWHQALLNRMKLPFQGRGAVLTPDTHELLNRMRSFRHRERNTFGFDLDTTIVLERTREMIQAYAALTEDVRRFLAEQQDAAGKL
jgi:hypothetical protein